MRAERWEQIDHLLQSALQRAPEQREVFLKEACDGDEALRREVESLLRAHEQASSFLEAPALEVEARAVANNQGQPGVGGMIGPYRMLTPLGAGGMGEVYRARDSRLGREVAIKVLPTQFIQDEDRLRRFIREAQAASALNHPNIITIYEIGQRDGTHFIATELIEGQTLRQRITPTGMKLPAALDVTIQAASALTAAHVTGIVHRDIKPENLMLRSDGLVKVLDFGLAKLTEQRPRAADSEAPTALKVSTDPGTVLGTVQYMSPEQARGLEVDARTDIFSLGVVLYEMLTGHAPFGGATKTDVLVAILEKEPAPLSRHVRALPAELERIVSKALAKDREERYQTVKDLLIDLKRLKQRLEYEQYREREGAEVQAEHSASATANGAALESGSKPAGAETAQSAAVSTGEAGTVHTISSAELIISEIKRHKRGVGLALLIFIIAGAGAAYWLYRLLDQRQPSAALKITRLTFTGKATQAAISLDGKYVAYVQAEGSQRSLWLSQVAVANHNQIVPPAEVAYQNLTFSPDGNFIYYNQTGPNNQSGLYQMPFTGGGARKLREDVRSAISFSPDGKQFAFLRGGSGPGQQEMVIASVDGSEEKVLATRKSPDLFNSGGPAWSPDGRIIACGVNNNSSGRWRNVVGVRVADGAEQPITAQRWNGDMGQVAWLSDGSGLVLTASAEAGEAPQVWLLSYPGNEARKITSDLSSYGRHLSLTADSRTLLAIRSEWASFNLWVAPSGDGRDAKQITSGSSRADGFYGLDWTLDGQIVYQSLAGGSVNIWMIGADGTGNKQLPTGAPPNTDPAISPDGRHLIWAPRRAGKRNIWRMNLDGSNQKQLTYGINDALPEVSPDGKWVIYTGYNSELNIRLWKVPIDGGDPVQLTDYTAQNPAISPDGKLIACRYQERGAPAKIAIIPFEGGPPISLFDYPDPGPGLTPTLVRWMPDGRAIAYIRTIGRVSNIWVQPLDGREPKQLTDFKELRLVNFAWSRDGKQLALSRGTGNSESDVVLISSFR